MLKGNQLVLPVGILLLFLVSLSLGLWDRGEIIRFLVAALGPSFFMGHLTVLNGV